MKHRIAAALALAVPLALFAAGGAQAAGTTCTDGSSSSSFYSPGAGSANINESTAWRYEAQRQNEGLFYVGAFTGDNATGLISQNSSSAAGVWVGRWSTNYAALANSEKVTNYGQATTIAYNRSCTAV